MFVHGLESGPQGKKVRLLREAGFEVHSEDMQMSVWQLGRRNSLVRQLPRLPEVQALSCVVAASLGLSVAVRRVYPALFGVAVGAGWFGARRAQIGAQALARSLEACVELQRRAIIAQELDILIGSSWGGAVALELALRGYWRGPLVLLAPSYLFVARYLGPDKPRQALEALGGLRDSGPIIIYHGLQDAVIPVADGEAIAAHTRAELHLVQDDHRLMRLFDDDAFCDKLRSLNA